MTRHPPSPLVVGAALAVVSLNLRAPVTAVGPVLDDIRHDLGFSATVAGLLTTTPLVLFGAAAPLAPRLTRRRAPEVVVVGALLLLAAGVVLRLPASVAALFAGTVVLGAAIAVANVLLPSVIKRDFPRPGTMMGVYSLAIGLAGALGAGLSVPLEHAFDSWRWGLVTWAVPAVLSAGLMLPLARRARAEIAASEPEERVTLWHDPLARRITGYFACQSLLFYVFAAWLPDILKAHGSTDSGAGFLLSLDLVLGLSTSFAVPIVAERLRDQRGLAVGAAALWMAGIVGLLLAPEAGKVLWVVLIGFGQGAGVSLVFTFFALRGPDGRHAAALSGMAQTVGYLVAATGPLSVGALHDLTGGWVAPLLLALCLATAMALFGLGAGRPGLVEGRAVRVPQLR